jgi:hypothetical protein
LLDNIEIYIIQKDTDIIFKIQYLTK